MKEWLIAAAIMLGVPLFLAGIVSFAFWIDNRKTAKANSKELTVHGYDKLIDMLTEFPQISDMANEFLAEKGKSLNDENLILLLGEFKKIQEMYYDLTNERDKQNSKDRLRSVASGQIPLPEPEPEPEEPEKEEEEKENRFRSLEM